MATSPALKFWVDEENFFEKIVVISEDTLFVANPNNKSIPDMIKKLENGESPAKIFKRTSQGMLLAAKKEGSDDLHLILIDENIPVGSRLG